MIKTVVRHTSPNLTDEIRQVKSLLISFIGTDPEGEYNPLFVKHAIAASREKPTRLFRNPTQFLKELKRKKWKSFKARGHLPQCATAYNG